MKELMQNIDQFLSGNGEQGGGELLDPVKAGQFILELAQQGSDEAFQYCQAIVQATNGRFSTDAGVNDTSRFFKHGNKNKKAIHFGAENNNPAWCQLLAPYFDVYTFQEEGMSFGWKKSYFNGGDAYHSGSGWSHTHGVTKNFVEKPPASGFTRGSSTFDQWSTTIEIPKQITRQGYPYSAFDRAIKAGKKENAALLASLGRINERVIAEIDAGRLTLNPSILATIRTKEFNLKIGFLYQVGTSVDFDLLIQGVSRINRNQLLQTVIHQLASAEIDEMRILCCRMVQDVLWVFPAFRADRVDGMPIILNTLWDLYATATEATKESLKQTFFAVLRYAQSNDYSVNPVSNSGILLFVRACRANDAGVIDFMITLGLGLLYQGNAEDLTPLEQVTDQALFSRLIGNKERLRKTFYQSHRNSVGRFFQGVINRINLENEQSVDQGCQLIVAVLPFLRRSDASGQENMQQAIRSLFDKALRVRTAGVLHDTFFALLRRLRSIGFLIDQVRHDAGDSLLAVACQSKHGYMVDLLLDFGGANCGSRNHLGQRPIDLVTDPILFDRLFEQVPASEKADTRYQFLSRTQGANLEQQSDYSYANYKLLAYLYNIVRQYTIGGQFNGVPVSQSGLDNKLQTKPNSRTAKIARLMHQVDKQRLADKQIAALGVSLFRVRQCKEELQTMLSSTIRVTPAVL